MKNFFNRFVSCIKDSLSKDKLILLAKDFLNFKILTAAILTGVFLAVIFISTPHIKLDASIQSLFPENEEMIRSASLSKLSPIADKVIIFIQSDNENKLKFAIPEIQKLINDSPVKFKNTIPGQSQMMEVLSYSQKYSLLLFPYENGTNPFTKDEMKKRLNAKANYLASIPFFNPDESFFMDPLMMGTDILKTINDSSKGKYSPSYDGVLSKDKKAYIMVLKSGVFSEDYEKIKHIIELDKRITLKGTELGVNSFLFSGHLFFWESKNTIQSEVSLFFTLSTILVFLIFLIFFRRLNLLFFSFLSITGGFAVAFLIIALFVKHYGGIALAFGSTTAGIAIDYTVFYLARRNSYSTLKETRKKIGFSLIWGFATTLICFLFLSFSSIPSFKEIALFGSLAIIISFIIDWFILQPLVPPGVFPSEITKINIPIFDKKAFIVWIGIMLVIIAFLPFLKFENDILKLDMNHKELNKKKDLVLKYFGESSDSIFLAFKGTDKDDLLKKSLDAFYIIKDQAPEFSFLTPAVFIPPKNEVELRKEFIKNNFSRNNFTKAVDASMFTPESFSQWMNTINNINGFNFDSLPEYLKQEFDSMFIQWKNNNYLLIPLYDRKISNGIKDILSKNKTDFFIIDTMNDGSKGMVEFEKFALLLLFGSVLFIFIVLAIIYKSLLHALCGILPCIAGLIGCASFSIISMGGFNIMHLVACILLGGITVDYGIFVTTAFKEKFNIEEIKSTYLSIFICGLTALSGFGVLSISKNYSIFSLGSGIVAGMVCAFLTIYLALPFLLKRIDKRKDI